MTKKMELIERIEYLKRECAYLLEKEKNMRE